MADNQENFVYRIQTEGFDGVKKAIDELAKKIDFLSTKILKQTQLLNSFDAQIKKLNTTILQSTSLSNTEKTQREAQIASITKQKKETQDYIKTLEAQVESLNKVIAALQSKSNVSATTASDAGGIKKESQQLKEVTTNTNKVTEATKKAKKEAEGFTGVLGKLGSVGSFVFGSILGMTAIGILRNIVNWFKQAIKAGKEFTNGIYQLAVGVRAMQRVGVDITIKDVYENIEKLRESFGIFTTQELVAGTASLMNLTRTFGFTKEQIFDLQESILTLAVVNSRAADEVQRVVALALSSGYTEGLQRLGISINKVTIAQKAANLGWDKGYNSLTEYQRALSTYILIQERVAAYEEDLKKYQETAPGRIDAAITAWKEFENEIGKDLIYLLAELADKFIALDDVLKFIGDRFREVVASIIAIIPLLEHLHKIRLDVMSLSFKKASEEIDNLDEAIKESDELYEKTLKSMGGYGEDVGKMPQLGDYLEDDFDDMLQSIEQYGKDLLKAQDEYQEGAKDAERDFGEDMRDIDNDYYEELTEITKDYWETIKEIDEKEQEDILDAREELAKDIADANKDFNEKIAEENEKYRENEIKAQKDYQEALRRLREEFLFDLEDALRKRDASQVMRLIRRYNLDKAQLDRERQEEKEENAKEHKEELADLKKERDDKIKELQEEFAERLAEIQKEAEKERIEADKQRKEEAAEARKNYEEEKKARQEEFNEEMEELKDHLEDRISELQIALADEYNLTDAELRSIGEIYKRMFGAGGVIEGQYDYFAEMTTSVVNHVIAEYQRMKDAADAAMETFAETSDTSNTNGATTAPTYSGAHASGGRVVATRPTLALFGESGIGEVAEFTPLNQVNSNLGGGKANIKISLAKGLIAEIVDNTMGQIGDIQLEVQR